MTEHTPGPWLRGEAMDGGKITFSHPESALTPIADVYTGLGREEAEANARLIAAAPEMLRVIEHVASLDGSELYYSNNSVAAMVRMAKYVMEKAKGEA